MTPGLQWVSLMLLTRIGWAGRYWALPFLTALVVSARYDRRKGRRHKTVTDYAQQMLVCLRRWLPDRDLVVVADGGYAKRECGIARTCQSRLSSSAQGRVPVPMRASAAAPARSGGPGWRAIAQSDWVLDDAGFPTAPPVSDGSTTMASSGVALWYHGGPPRLPIRVIREERRGPMLCYAPTPGGPLRIDSGICCAGRSR